MGKPHRSGLFVKVPGPDGTIVERHESELPVEERKALWAGILADARREHLPALEALVNAPEPRGHDDDARFRRALREAAMATEVDTARGEIACALDEWAFRSGGTSTGMVFVEDGEGGVAVVDLGSSPPPTETPSRLRSALLPGSPANTAMTSPR